MRNRTTILCLLACLLAAYPAFDSNRQQAICADRYSSDDFFGPVLANAGDSGGCAESIRQTQLERLLEVLAGICGLGGCISAGKSWRDRQQDRALLRGSKPPVWGSRVPYR